MSSPIIGPYVNPDEAVVLAAINLVEKMTPWNRNYGSAAWQIACLDLVRAVRALERADDASR